MNRIGVSQVTLVVKNLTATAEDKRCGFDPWVRKIPWREGRATQEDPLEEGRATQEDPLEEGRATHSSIPA